MSNCNDQDEKGNTKDSFFELIFHSLLAHFAKTNENLNTARSGFIYNEKNFSSSKEGPELIAGF